MIDSPIAAQLVNIACIFWIIALTAKMKIYLIPMHELLLYRFWRQPVVLL